MTLLRRMAIVLAAAGARLMPPRPSDWGQAMVREVMEIDDDGRALLWGASALGAGVSERLARIPGLVGIFRWGFGLPFALLGPVFMGGAAVEAITRHSLPEPILTGSPLFDTGRVLMMVSASVGSWNLIRRRPGALGWLLFTAIVSEVLTVLVPATETPAATATMRAIVTVIMTLLYTLQAGAIWVAFRDRSLGAP